MFGMRELLIILVIVLVVFGTKKIRPILSDLGAGVRDFKKAMSEGEHEEEEKRLKALASTPRDAEFSGDKKADAKTEPKSGA
jgi:sec-independent protein translocase protein TatA